MKNFFKWESEPNGQCPVQATGRFLGFYFYFRARNETGSIAFYKDKGDYYCENPIWYSVLKRTKPYEAGFLSKNYCKWLIYKGCLIFIFKA